MSEEFWDFQEVIDMLIIFIGLQKSVSLLDWLISTVPEMLYDSFAILYGSFDDEILAA